jgi:hypothetical protein
VPEVKHDHGVRDNLIHLLALMGGIALLSVVRLVPEP